MKFLTSKNLSILLGIFLAISIYFNVKPSEPLIVYQVYEHQLYQNSFLMIAEIDSEKDHDKVVTVLSMMINGLQECDPIDVDFENPDYKFFDFVSSSVSLSAANLYLIGDEMYFVSNISFTPKYEKLSAQSTEHFREIMNF